MSLDQLIAVDALAAVALAAAVTVHGRHIVRQAAEDRRRLLRRFATGELDLDTYERASPALGARQTAAPLIRRLSIGHSPSR